MYDRSAQPDKYNRISRHGESLATPARVQRCHELSERYRNSYAMEHVSYSRPREKSRMPQSKWGGGRCAVRCGIPDAYPSGRKGAESDERRRDETRRDDEGRRGSRTAALNAVPSDRQHRLLRGSFSARSDSELSLCVLVEAPPRSHRPPLSFSLCYFLFFSHALSFSTTPLPPLFPATFPPHPFLSSPFCISVAWPRQPRQRRRKSRRGWKTRDACSERHHFSRVSGGRVCRAFRRPVRV